MSQNDKLPILTRNGKPFDRFSCETPSLCDREMPLKDLIAAVEAKSTLVRTIDSTVGRRRGFSTQSFHNLVVREGSRLTVNDLLANLYTQTVFPDGVLHLGWCPNALSVKGNEGCPASPVPFNVEWKAGAPVDISLSGMPPGLHRLMHVRNVRGLDLWGEEAAWVLIIASDQQGSYQSAVEGLAAVRDLWKTAPKTAGEASSLYTAEAIYLASQVGRP